MWEAFPLTAAWRAVRQRPAVLLIPLVWDLLKWVLALTVSSSGYYFRLWDFAIGYDFRFTGGYARVILPPSLPSATQLGAAVPIGVPDRGYIPYLIMGVVLVANACVKGGFLHLLNESLHGVAPSLKGFFQGIGLFGAQLTLIGAAWAAWSSMIETLATGGHVGLTARLVLNLIAVVLLFTAEFVTVADDAWVLPAILGGPLLLWEYRGQVLVALAFSGGTAAAVTALASWAGVARAPLLAPVQAVLGTVAAAAMLQVLHTETGEHDAASRTLGA